MTHDAGEGTGVLARLRRPLFGAALLVAGALGSIASRFLDWGTYVDPAGVEPSVRFTGDAASFAGLFLAAGIAVLAMVVLMLAIPRYVKLWAVFAFVVGLGSLQGALFIAQQATSTPGLTVTWALALVLASIVAILTGGILAFLRR